MDLTQLTSIIESIVFVSGNAISVKDISERLEVTDKEVIKAAKELQKKYGDDCGLHLLIFNNKLQFCSNPKNAETVSIVLNPIKERELSRSMLETVAIIAYKQPVTRLDLEELRGNSEYAIQNLLKLGVIEIVGRKDAIGRPVLFGTTDEFLKRFQIGSLDELPDYDELMDRIRRMNGTNNQDSYLYRKDEYVEGQDLHGAKQIDITDIPTQGQTSEKTGDNDFELNNFYEEELPDFLADEDFDIISGEDDN